MIRKLIPAVLIATLAACANTGQRTSSADADGATSSTPSTSTAPSDSGGYGGSYGGRSTDSGTYGGAYGGGAYSPSFADGRSCDAQPVQKMIGTTLTSSVENQIKQASSSSKSRVLKPGEVMTMEYDPHRINLILDNQGALTALRCG